MVDPRQAGYVPVAEAIKRTGISPRLFARRASAGEIMVFLDPFDRRRRLVSEADLPTLTEVRPRTLGSVAREGRKLQTV